MPSYLYNSVNIDRNIIPMPNEIHNGEVTHHQDQVATTPIPANFNTKNIKNTTVLIPIPLFLLFSITFIYLF